jgi:acetoin utilization protein AcuB
MKVQHEHVANWMSRELIIGYPHMLLEELYHLMLEHNVRRIPIVSPPTEEQASQLLGMVTYGDVRGAIPSTVPSVGVWEKHYLHDHLTAAKFMSKDPITVAETASIGEAARKMLENRISGLPVLDEDKKLVGIITESDIFRMVIRQEWEAEME